MPDTALFTRRRLLQLVSAAAATVVHARAESPWLGSFVQSSDMAASQLSKTDVADLLRPVLSTTKLALFDLAVDAYQQCILNKIRAAEPPFRHPWIVPGGPYLGQWLWDTAFVADLLAVIPDKQTILRGVYQNYWDNCDRWNASHPAYAHGMIANFISPENSTNPRFDGTQWRTYPAYSQAPLVAWGMERVFRRNGDLTMVHTALPYLEAFHDWYWRERDVTNVGLVGVGTYSADIEQARYETYDLEVDLDSLHLTPHPTRRGPGEGNWYGDILIPANTSYLLLSEASLIRLATAAGDSKLADRRRPYLAKGKMAMRQHMWDQASGCFLAVRRGSLAKIPSPTIGGFTALMAEVPTKAQAARMAEALASPAWSTPLPVPTVARTDPAYESSKFWRGDVWPATVYQVATGLATYGHHAAAAHIADRMIDNAMRVGINERYDSLTGKPVGVGGLGMSATIITMALDGLSPQNHMVATAGGLNVQQTSLQNNGITLRCEGRTTRL